MGIPFASQRVETDGHHFALPHAHAEGQITFVEWGAVSLEAGGRVWAVPRGRLHWIPAGVVHASRAHGPVRFWLTRVSPARSDRLPAGVCVLKASPLIAAALARLRTIDPEDALAGPLVDVIGHEVAEIGGEEPGMMLPRGEKMRAWALAFIAAPTIKIGIDRAAADLAMSRRSFTRHFEREVGMSFARWRRAVSIHHAITRLAGGDSVSAVAFDLGYDGVSAFVAMFRAARGVPPGAFIRAAREG